MKKKQMGFRSINGPGRGFRFVRISGYRIEFWERERAGGVAVQVLLQLDEQPAVHPDASSASVRRPKKRTCLKVNPVIFR